jgi:uncharacterized protein (DUF697 family)/tellurite resistance protein
MPEGSTLPAPVKKTAPVSRKNPAPVECRSAIPNRPLGVEIFPGPNFFADFMTTLEKESICLVALAAAFCDGAKSDAERAQFRGLLDQLELPNAAQLVSRALLNRAALPEAVAGLTTPESRTLAYEMAVCVIEADGHRNPAETQFLTALAGQLQIAPEQSARTLKVADEVVAAAALPAATAAPTPPPPRAADAALEATIRRTAIFAGALELLPQSAATLAVLPLQTHLVYRVGKHYGHTLDAGHVKEFLGVLGLGLASQAVEGMARKLLGGLVRRAGGTFAGTLASVATGPAVTFASTYALGHLAQRYYSGGRTLSALQLKETFRELLGQARAQSVSLLPEIQERARGLNLAQLPSLIRGG